MRGGKGTGRFDVDYESLSISGGIKNDIGEVVGQQVEWWQWSESYFTANHAAIIDDIYDVSSSIGVGAGRRWAAPVSMPTVMASVTRSGNKPNERGFYTTDTLRIVLNVADAERLIPGIVSDPNSHDKDRIVYRGEVWEPNRVLPRGSFGYHWAVIAVDCTQVNSEELVNDPQFLQYATHATPDLGNPTTIPVTVPPLVTVQPLAVAVTAPNTATFTVAVAGTPSPRVQWQVNAGTGFLAIAGATALSYTTGATTTSMNGYQFRALVSSDAGTTLSDGVGLTVS